MIRDLKLVTYLLIALVVMVAGAFGLYYWQATGSIKDQSATITNLQQQLDSDKTQMAGLQVQVANLQSSVTSVNNQVTSLASQLTNANGQVTSTQSSLSSLNNQVSSLQSQLTAANAQITSLQTQNANLTSTLSLTQQTAITSGYAVNQPFGQETAVAYFNPTYAGYIVVTGYSSSANGYVRVTDTFTSYPYTNTKLPFGAGTSLYIPVLPGSATVYFGNTEAAGTVTGAISVTYYY